jgi:cytoskeletal protein RodZ
MRLHSHLRPALFTALPLALLALLPLALSGEDKPAAPSLVVESIQVEPSAPGPDTLCHLTVTLKNQGDRPASALELTVKVGGATLPAYRDRLFLEAVEPGASRQVKLFNFWSTETGRAAPADRKLAVEVTLTAASWMKRETKNGATVWTPAGAVAGLPSAKSLSLAMAKGR